MRSEATSFLRILLVHYHYAHTTINHRSLSPFPTAICKKVINPLIFLLVQYKKLIDSNGRFVNKLMKEIIVISHTHWDREWYRPLEEFRQELANMIDNLLGIMDRDSRFKYFHLDGQTVVIEDYLHLRPENEDRLVRYIREGNVLVGPWYVQPDEFLVSGEAHIRNLLIGHRIAQRYGSPMKVGYVPDCFGHISQLPQILRGFDIDCAMLWRGVGNEVTTTELTWESPDGSSVLLVYLLNGYSNAVELPDNPRELLQRVNTEIESLEPWATTRYLVFMNGSDHKYLQSNLPDLMDIIRSSRDDISVTQSTMPQLIDNIRREDPALPVYRGEFRSPLRSNILPGVYSARIYLKQMNTRLEHLVEKMLEPVAVFASLNGHPYPKTALADYWKQLIKNNPHDSICGCSVDLVHDQMEERFQELFHFGKALLDTTLETCCGLVNTAGATTAGATTAGTTAGADKNGDGFTPLIVFNPLDGPRSGPVTLTLENGDAGHEVNFVPRNIPPFGYKTYAVRPVENPSSSHQSTGFEICELISERERSTLAPVALLTPQAERVFSTSSASLGPAIENEHYRVELNPKDGTLTVTDLGTATVLTGINRFVDEGDAGDEYNFSPPEKGNRIISSGEVSDRALVTVSDQKQTMEYELIYDIPDGLTDERSRRSPATKPCRITSRVSLYPGIKRIDFETSVDNRSRDHRLRTMFPSALTASHSLADGHFDQVKRSVAIPGGQQWFEQPVGQFPQKNYTVWGNGDEWFILLNKGIPEVELMERDGRAVAALTLIRAVGWLSRDDFVTRNGHAGPEMATPGAQCLRQLRFEYAIFPRATASEMKLASRLGAWYNNPLNARTTGIHQGKLHSSGSFLTIEPAAVVLSALKLAEDDDAVILRIFNSEDHPVNGTIGFFKAFSTVKEVNLNEQDLKSGPGRLWTKLSVSPE